MSFFDGKLINQLYCPGKYLFFHFNLSKLLCMLFSLICVTTLYVQVVTAIDCDVPSQNESNVYNTFIEFENH